MTEEMLLTLIDRLTARVVELEAWQERMAESVITKAVITKRVLVQQKAGGPFVRLQAYADWSEVRVALGDGDRDAKATLLACDESDPPEAILSLQVDDEDRVMFTTLQPEQLAEETS